MMKIDKILNQIQDDKIEYILAQFVDIHGSPKVKMVPVNHINDLVDDGSGFVFCFYGYRCSGLSIYV